MRILASGLLITALWAAWPTEGRAQVMTDERFIRSLYKELLNRTPTRREVNYWAGVIEERAWTRMQTRLHFLAEEEFFKLHQRDQARTVRAWYQHLLGRRATRAEVDTWVDRWREYHGNDRSALVNDFYQNAVVPEKEGR